jgi:hypothetical protein
MGLKLVLVVYLVFYGFEGMGGVCRFLFFGGGWEYFYESRLDLV